MLKKRPPSETLTILYLKCPICTESSLISQWATACFDMPTYQRSVLIAAELNEESWMICPKCCKNSLYGDLINLQNN